MFGEPAGALSLRKMGKMGTDRTTSGRLSRQPPLLPSSFKQKPRCRQESLMSLAAHPVEAIVGDLQCDVVALKQVKIPFLGGVRRWQTAEPLAQVRLDSFL